MGPNEQRWNDAINQIRERGVIIRENVEMCCRSCIGARELGLTEEEYETKPWAYTYGSQLAGYGWLGDVLVNYNDEAGSYEVGCEGTEIWVSRPELDRYLDVVYFCYPDGPQDPANIIAEVFKANGFDIKWDGTSDKYVGIKNPTPMFM